jgi:hypothetical protein
MEIDRVTSKLPSSEVVATNVSTVLASKDLLSLPPLTTPPPTQSMSPDHLPLKEAPNEIAPARSGTEANLSLTQVLPIPDPFAGFIGRSFLRFCQAVELFTGWIKPRNMPAELAAQSLLSSPSSPWRHWGACSLGTICCTVVAAVLIPLFSASSTKAFLPIPFLFIIVLVAFGFGRAAGVLGTLAAAFLFAWFLYEPAGLAVSDPVAKSHLIWMLIIGVLLSDLLGRFRMRLSAIAPHGKGGSHS